MESVIALVTVVLGLLVRLGLPLLATAGLIWWLKRLDAHWQAEAESQAVQPAAPAVRCWEINGCPPERRARCPANANPDVPCWQVFRGRRGRLRADCLGCDVFRLAPAPAH